MQMATTEMRRRKLSTKKVREDLVKTPMMILERPAQ